MGAAQVGPDEGAAQLFDRFQVEALCSLTFVHQGLRAGFDSQSPVCGAGIRAHDAVTALRAIVGKPVVSARTRLRFGPGRTYESLARMLDRAINQAENADLDPALLVVADGSARMAEDIVRVRRRAYGIADWIHSPTCRVEMVLLPAGQYTGAETVTRKPTELSLPTGSGASANTADERAGAIREALSDVIDPDLGVNIVDLGFVRAVVDCSIGACSLALPAGTFGERSPEPRRWWTSWESNPARRARSSVSPSKPPGPG